MEAGASESAGSPAGHVVSEMVAGLEDHNVLLVAENASLRQELERVTTELASLQKDVMDIEAERDDWIKEYESQRKQRKAERDLMHQQVKAEYEQQYQVLTTNLSVMDHETWFAIIASRESAYQFRVQKLQLEIQRLAAANRQVETEMAVLRSFSMEFSFAMSPG
jgi:chromosome segregation ATPase